MSYAGATFQKMDKVLTFALIQNIINMYDYINWIVVSIIRREVLMEKKLYTAPQAIIIDMSEKVNTLDTISGDKEGSRVLLSWLVD